MLTRALNFFVAFFAVGILAGVFAVTGHAQTVAIPIDPANPKNVVQADLLLPAGDAKVPALLIAPGEGYHRNLAITAGLAESAAASGWATLRFDWRYYSNNPADGRASRDFIAEQADFEAALAFLKKHPRVDASRIVIAGKSMGSIVVGRAFVADTTLRALLLFTPVCRSGGDAAKNYHGVIADKRPVIVVMGNRDGICPLANLYYWAKDGDPRIAVLTFPGDHGLLVGSAQDSALAPRKQRNIDHAINAAVHWLNEIIAK